MLVAHWEPLEPPNKTSCAFFELSLFLLAHFGLNVLNLFLDFFHTALNG